MSGLPRRLGLARGPRSARDTGVSPLVVGAVALAAIVIGSWFAFTKANPFASPYELQAIFESANNLGVRAPVRIAGVDVGKVTKVEPMPDGSGLARVTMELDEQALPIRRDAELKVRSRLFLEGNYFVDLRPGTPSAPELESGDTVPMSQTARPVQFGELLSALQSDTREDLQTLLKEYSDALRGSGARGFNQAIRHWEEAYRSSALVSRATLGRDEHDLSRLLRGQGRVFGALARDERALEELVTGLNRTVSGFARQEDALRAAIPELRDVLAVGRPALASLNDSLPHIRAFARDALPGARSSRATLDAQLPFIRQARRLVSRAEGRGLAADLRATVPALVRLNERTPATLEMNRALAACQNNVLLPFSTTPIPDPSFPEHSGEAFYEESPRAFVGLAGESRIADANSPMFRVLGGGGPTTIVQTGETGEQYFAQMPFPIDGVRPAKPGKAPVFRPNVPCETQDPPDMNAVSGPGDEQVEPNARPTAADRRRTARAKRELELVGEHMNRVLRGLPSIDPLEFSPLGERLQARRLGLERTPDGGWRKKEADR